MTRTVDLNADMGESFGAWTMGDDAALLEIVTSANIACGFHAGDPDVMAHVMSTAHLNGVGIGSHPGFRDVQGFGRRRMDVPMATLKNWVRYQLAASIGMAKAVGAEVRHLKLHGALSNMACEDIEMAKGLFDAALSVDPDIVIMVLAATPMEQAARDLGCAWAGEIFADRAYREDGLLVDRRDPGAVIHDPEIAAARMVEMVKADAIMTDKGVQIEASIDTICVHGDTPEAVELARAVRSGLEASGVVVAPLGRAT
ncbi:LamB/YcsF family protein [Chachezhania antarctica]|uniref:LamB/YcsF family protein n=1 Tax=Chachezhania antarctica TaxID=2340860 RepID=UPI000EB35B05|nr:5-oxoprolinase subunit PxpA [Chachezhania antarctica]